MRIPKTQYIKTIDTGEKIFLGPFTLVEPTDLVYVKAYINKQGTLGGSEQLRVNIYADSVRETVVHSSAWFDFSTIPDMTSNWYGWVRFDFTEQSLDKDTPYYFELELSNYTRNADVFYFSSILDWPHRTNTSANVTKAASKIEIIGKK